MQMDQLGGRWITCAPAWPRLSVLATPMLKAHSALPVPELQAILSAPVPEAIAGLRSLRQSAEPLALQQGAVGLSVGPQLLSAT